MNMIFRAAWLLLLAAVVPAAMAEICTPDYGYEGYSYMVWSQSDLDKISAECTTINGSIFMGMNYTGGFHLPNVRNITGLIRWFRWGPEWRIPTPTFMDLPDLEFLGEDLDMNGLPTLRSFTAPKLQTVGWEAKIEYAQEVDLRSLVDLEYLSIIGNVSSLRLDSLRQVRESLILCTMDECDPKNSTTALNLSLPALHDVGHMDVEGRFSSFDTPSLTNVSGYGTGVFESIKFITSGGPPINISFPELKYIDGEGITLEGNIANISIPEITNMSVWFSVDAYDQLAIDLPFQEAVVIALSGNITSVQFPNLTSLSYEFSVNSNAALDCKSLTKTIMAATNKSSMVYCQTSSASRFGPGLGVTIVFGLVLGVGVGLL